MFKGQRSVVRVTYADIFTAVKPYVGADVQSDDLNR